jgi:hypothetical protein
VPPAHVVASATVPLALVWIAVVLLGAGGFAVVTLRQAWARRLGASLALAGLPVAAVLELLGSIAPPSPGYTIAVATPDWRGSVTSPVRVLVCGRLPDGSARPAPDPSSVLLVAVDGREVLASSSPGFAIAMSAGAHVLQVELLDRAHREYRPRIQTRVDVDVDGVGPLQAAPQCAQVMPSTPAGHPLIARGERP